MASNADNPNARAEVARGDSVAAKSGRTLWLWVAAAFLFLAILWTALFIAADRAQIERVPLQPKGQGK